MHTRDPLGKSSSPWQYSQSTRLVVLSKTCRPKKVVWSHGNMKCERGPGPARAPFFKLLFCRALCSMLGACLPVGRLYCSFATGFRRKLEANSSQTRRKLDANSSQTRRNSSQSRCKLAANSSQLVANSSPTSWNSSPTRPTLVENRRKTTR